MKTLEMEQTQKQQTELTLTRVIRASRSRVYEAWTRPEIIQQWFAPGNMTVPSATLDVRQGGAYTIEMRGSMNVCEGNSAEADMSRSALVQGVYREVVPNQRIQFTWCGNWDRSETSVVTVTFRDVEGGTEITLHQEQFASEASRDKHQQGWSATLTKLANISESSR